MAELIQVLDSSWPQEVRRTDRRASYPADGSAARAARVLARAGQACLVILADGTERLYRPAWAEEDVPFRVRCRICRKLRRYPRSNVCDACFSPTDTHRDRVAESNRRRARRPAGGDP